MPALLSVVVPVFDVGSYLRPCLESVLGSRGVDVEVLCIDDGSTDGSGEVLDRWAATEPRLRVQHVPNGGPGRARNLGSARAQGRYLTFVDADDRVPPRGLGLLCASLERTGSQIATGRVRRFSDTRSWSSELHVRATPTALERTTLAASPSLLYDSTASNKVFRRDFWDGAGLAFPEGRLYEDVVVAARAYVAAEQVDVLTQTVYEWRRRGGELLSTTQRGADVTNLQARLAALDEVRSVVSDAGRPQLVRELDRKVLLLDLPLYLGRLPELPLEARELLGQLGRATLARVEDADLARLPVRERLALALVAAGALDEAAQVVEQGRSATGPVPVRRVGRRLVADLPGRRRGGLVPSSVYDVTASTPLETAVTSVRLDGEGLTVTGTGQLRAVELSHRWSARRRLVLVDPDGEVVASAAARSASGADAGFVARIPLAELSTAGRAERVLQARLVLTDLTGRHEDALSGPRGAAAEVIEPYVADDGRYVVAYWTVAGALRVTVRQRPPLVAAATFDGDGLQLDLLLTEPCPVGATLTWRRGGAGGGGEVQVALRPTTSDPRAVRARLPLSAVLAGASDAAGDEPAGADADDDAGQVTWRATLDGDGQRRAVVVAPRLLPVETTSAGHQVALRTGPGGRALLVVRAPEPVVRAASWDRGRLTLTLTSTTAPDDHLVALRGPHGQVVSAVDGPTSPGPASSGRSISVTFEVLDLDRDVSLPAGRWTLALLGQRDGVRHWRALDLTADAAVAAETTIAATSAQVIVAAGPRRLTLEVSALDPAPDAAFTAGPPSDLVLVNSSGCSVSPDLLALATELARHEPAVRVGWVRPDPSTSTPPGVRSALAGSTRHRDLLDHARCVITDGGTPGAPAPTVDAADEGTAPPVVRVGFTTLPGTLALALATNGPVTGQQVVTADPDTSADVRAAHGHPLELGLPRHDVLVTRAAQGGRADARTRLGIDDECWVVLWAPARRPDHTDALGRPVLRLPFDLSALDDVLTDGLLLVRADPALASDAAGAWAGQGRVRNVTTCPDPLLAVLAADVVLTDYSSVALDATLIGRVVVLYPWDLASRPDVDEPAYLDRALGAVARTEDELTRALRAARGGDDAVRRARESAPHADGAATARLVEHLLGSIV